LINASLKPGRSGENQAQVAGGGAHAHGKADAPAPDRDDGRAGRRAGVRVLWADLMGDFQAS